MATPTYIKALQIKKDENTIYKLTIEDLLKKDEADDYYAQKAPNGGTYATQEYVNTAIGNLTNNNTGSGNGTSGTTTGSSSHTHSIGQIYSNNNIALDTYLSNNYVAKNHTIDDLKYDSTISLSSYLTNNYATITALNDYIPTSSITTTISGSTTSDYIPTEAAIIKYLNSLAVGNNQF